MTTVVKPWLAELPWKQQSIFFSGLRGPDAPNVPAIKIVNRWMRSVSQENADPSKPYMQVDDLPSDYDLCSELEYLPVHYVHHLADALAVVAYGHDNFATAAQAARYHYRIAEELFHFIPEPRHYFQMRHRDKPDGKDENASEWSSMQEDTRCEFIDAALSRFPEPRA